MSSVVAAVDLGATSGRVILGRFDGPSFALSTVHRFANTPVETSDGLHWNILELYRNVVLGLGLAVREEPGLASIGIDSWGCDYALMHGGRMVGTPYHYRDRRCEAGARTVHGTVTPQQLYPRNGLQYLPFNTLYQLAAEDDLLASADAMLLIPDLLAYWLGGYQICEATNASTTGLVDVRTREWDTDLAGRLNLPSRILQPLTEPGTSLGGLRPAVAKELSAPGSLALTTVGSHDTASAVVAMPMDAGDAAYISCGTWGLVGVEVEQPVLSDEARGARFTNERGVDQRIRFLHNVMGLWLLSEAIRQWERDGDAIDLPALVAQAGDVGEPVPVFDVDDARFIAAGDMPKRVAEYCRDFGLPTPDSRPAMVRCILESLAEAFARSVDRAAELTRRRVDVIHIVGGGSQNRLLCQLTADRSGKPVLAGPVEATALGNVLIQARALGEIHGDLEALRPMVAAMNEPVRYLPQRAG